MSYAIVNVPVAAVRKKPNHRKEMTNQLLFGESVLVIKEKGIDWVKVKSLHDDYEGWLTCTQIEKITKEEAFKSPVYFTSGLLNAIQYKSTTYLLPLGAILPVFDAGNGKIAGEKYVYAGDFFDLKKIKPSANLLTQLTNKWLNVPYLWGGRTLLGVDCSGFVQLNFKMMGLQLPRDAWQQAQVGEPVKKLADARCGDLVFFDDRDEIVHVGILLDNETIIHAAGKVRKDTIDKKGIIHAGTGKYTHRLKAIRRIW